VPPRALNKETDKRACRWARYRVLGWRTLGKGNLFAECHLEHSAKVISLPSVTWNTRQRHHLRYRSSGLRLFFAEYRVTLSKVFVECPIKSTRQRSRCQYTVRRAFFAECYTRYSLCRVFSRLCRVLFRHSAKSSIPVAKERFIEPSSRSCV
jgi:hypothetical protein